jgi:CubicO group peptidase (beta-lactamase class C family)
MYRSSVRYLSLILGLAVASTPLAASAAPPMAEATDAATRIDTYLRGRVPHLRMPGFALVVVVGDQVILSRGYGVADRAAGTPMTEDTPVAIVEQGLVDLDAPVIRYVPDFTLNDPRAVDVTVRQVLTHTAGLPAGGLHDPAQDDEALERHIASLVSTELRFAPGGGYEYANDGYSVAGLVVQRVSGVPYEDYLAAQVFEPLSMARTTFDVSRVSGDSPVTARAAAR